MMRFDIAIVVFLILCGEVLFNTAFPYEQKIYDQLEESIYEIGYPASEDVPVVSTVAEIQAAEENNQAFALKIDASQLEKTKYVYLKQYANAGLSKGNAFQTLTAQIFERKNYDRMYIAELEDGNRIVVRLLERTMKLKGDDLILPVSECHVVTSPSENYSALADQFDVNTWEDETWYVDASGYMMVQSTAFENAQNRRFVIQISVMGILMLGYAIVSTIFIHAFKKVEKEREQAA